MAPLDSARSSCCLKTYDSAMRHRWWSHFSFTEPFLLCFQGWLETRSFVIKGRLKSHASRRNGWEELDSLSLFFKKLKGVRTGSKRQDATCWPNIGVHGRAD